MVLDSTLSGERWLKVKVRQGLLELESRVLQSSEQVRGLLLHGPSLVPAPLLPSWLLSLSSSSDGGAG